MNRKKRFPNKKHLLWKWTSCIYKKSIRSRVNWRRLKRSCVRNLSNTKHPNSSWMKKKKNFPNKKHMLWKWTSCMIKRSLRLRLHRSKLKSSYVSKFVNKKPPMPNSWRKRKQSFPNKKHSLLRHKSCFNKSVIQLRIHRSKLKRSCVRNFANTRPHLHSSLMKRKQRFPNKKHSL